MRRQTQKILYGILVLLLLAGVDSTAQAAINCPGALPSGAQGLSYTYTFTGSAGNGGTPWWRIVFGSLPPGLSLTGQSLNSVNLTGTPTSSGTYMFAISHREPGMDPICFCTIVINAAGCSFTGTSTGSILFDIDPLSAGPINNSIITPVNFRCVAGTTYTVSYTSAQVLSGTNNSIPFTLVLASGGTSSSSTTDIPLLTTNSAIYAADYRNAYAETDSVTVSNVTINWTGNTGSPIYATVNASGTVINTCSFTGSPALNFGVIDAVVNAAGATATVTPPVLVCTTGAAVTVTHNGGLNYLSTPRLKDSSNNYINYIPGFTSPLSGAGASIDIGGSGAGRLSLSATIPSGALDAAPAGMYSDIITLTISY
ncbi:MAG: spore coat U domain-containing protein [Deltaproteobacteria bacterium]|nr:spore coat U domain-containing protein [Deltaproteobacteria bacterium]